MVVKVSHILDITYQCRDCKENVEPRDFLFNHYMQPVSPCCKTLCVVVERFVAAHS